MTAIRRAPEAQQHPPGKRADPVESHVTGLLPPLVEAGPPLDRAALERYSRHLLLPDVGELGQRRLANARVAVIGAGGLGSVVLTYLAAAGVGTIGIVDFDMVELSNLQRQTIHGVSDIGRLKTVSAVETLAAINPTVEVRSIDLRLDASNALETLAGYDLVIDGTDNFATRYLVNDVCVLMGIPYVWGSVFRFEGQVSVFWAAHGPQYREVFPTPPPVGSVPSCGEGGVLGVVCGAIGSLMATEAVKLICGIGRPLVGRLLVYDALTTTIRTVTIRRDPAAVPIVGLVDYDVFCGAPQCGETAAESAPSSGVSATELAALIADANPLTVVDVREPAEFGFGAIPGALLVPLGQIVDGSAVPMLRQASAAGDLVLYCKSGTRSARAAELLRDAGLDQVRNLLGGIQAWRVDVDPTLPRY